eukprot:5387625-Pyramimonas_sp.AAC.1
MYKPGHWRMHVALQPQAEAFSNLLVFPRWDFEVLVGNVMVQGGLDRRGHMGWTLGITSDGS